MKSLLEHPPWQDPERVPGAEAFLEKELVYRSTVTEAACREQRRMLEACHLVAGQFLAQRFWVPNALNILQYQPKRRKRPDSNQITF